MKNHNVTTTYKRTTNKIEVEVWKSGWEDAQAGRGYRTEYETWTRRYQQTYEDARLCYSQLKSFGVATKSADKIFVRNHEGIYSFEDEFSSTVAESIRKIGPYVPKKGLLKQDNPV